MADDLGGPLAIDFVPVRYRAHRAVRLLLPFRDAADQPVSWSRFAPADASLSASLGWHELLERAGESPDRYAAATGVLDERTAAALGELVTGLQMTCLRWSGYADDAAGATVRDAVDLDGRRYARSSLDAADLVAGARIPEFAWDAQSRLAWGGRLYPDSVVIAADLDHFRRLHADERITVTSVRTERDVLPPSAGD